jgi:hypothetical protein
MVAVTRPGAAAGLKIFDACGATVHALFSSHDSVDGLAWSPDSAYLAAIVNGDPSGNHPFGAHLMLIDIATGTATTVATGFLDGFGSPTFAPGTPVQLAYDNSLHVGGNSEIWSVTPGAAPTQVTRSGENEDPLWGPNGILYVRTANSGTQTLMRAVGTSSTAVMKLDGWPVAIDATGRHLLAEGAACGVIWPFTVDLAHQRVVHHFANGFAPYGITASGATVLIAGSKPGNECGSTTSHIQTAPFAGGAPHTIATGTDPSWATSAAANVQGDARRRA